MKLLSRPKSLNHLTIEMNIVKVTETFLCTSQKTTKEILEEINFQHLEYGSIHTLRRYYTKEFITMRTSSEENLSWSELIEFLTGRTTPPPRLYFLSRLATL